jgi:hypothetical protein
MNFAKPEILCVVLWSVLMTKLEPQKKHVGKQRGLVEMPTMLVEMPTMLGEMLINAFVGQKKML